MKSQTRLCLKNCTAIVTGASRGIGREVANVLFEAGANVYGVSRTQLDDQLPKGFQYLQCDITEDGQFAEVIDRVLLQHRTIDILVNCAGVSEAPNEGMQSIKRFREILNTNLIAAYDCALQVLPCMKKNSQGSIINVTSIGGLLGFPGNPGYAASKGGLAALSRALANDLGPFGIRVNNVVPGYIKTAMTLKSYDDPRKYKIRASRSALGRWGNTSEIANAVLFLASSESSFITGADLVVDGGWTIKGM